MIRSLQKLFPSLITTVPKDRALYEQYEWYVTAEHEKIGILKSELTTKEATLLATFLVHSNSKLPRLTTEERMWKKRLESGEVKQHAYTKTSFRFVYFHIEKQQIDPTSFNEAIKALFSKRISILWESEQEGILIEEQTLTDEAIDFKRIINILISDLYVDIKFFVGLFQRSLKHIATYYETIKQTAQIMFTYSNQAVVHYPEAIPYILLHQTKYEVRDKLISDLLAEFAEDTDMLQTIQTFFQCHLNVSVTAKEMYMHRNSLQYRIDKFHDKTGLDIQQFDQALAVYVAIIAKRFHTSKDA